MIICGSGRIVGDPVAAGGGAWPCKDLSAIWSGWFDSPSHEIVKVQPQRILQLLQQEVSDAGCQNLVFDGIATDFEMVNLILGDSPIGQRVDIFYLAKSQSLLLFLQIINGGIGGSRENRIGRG